MLRKYKGEAVLQKGSKSILLLTIPFLVFLLVSGCAHQASLRVYPDAVPFGSLRLVQVMVLGTRAHIVREKAWYDALLKSGIPDEEIKDGSLAVGRVYCCGGPAELPTRQAFYVPADVQVQPMDIVEIRAGREPTEQGDGQVNVVTRVVQRANASESTCRWVPPNPRLVMRVLYCDWMEKEEWIEKNEGMLGHHTWLKPPASK